MNTLIISEPMSISDPKGFLRFCIKQVARKLRCIHLGTYVDPRGNSPEQIRELLRSLVAEYVSIRSQGNS